jgi:putative ABC transport system substrate-binding protein
MRRREFIGVLGGVAAMPLAARAQQQGRTYRVGLLAPGQLGPADERRRAILQGLATRGFVEGRNLIFDVRLGEPGRYEALPALAAALRDAKADVIITFGYPAALAAKTAIKDVPIVVLGSGDPVATGLAEGLARPGGNLTGMTELSTELSAKRLEILKDAVPNLRQVAMLSRHDAEISRRRNGGPGARRQGSDPGRARAERLR